MTLYRIALAVTALFALYVLYAGYGAYHAWSAKNAIFKAPAEIVIGPQDAALTVVKFMDYACPYCRDIHPALNQALQEDGKTRLIVRALPSQNPDGSRAARLAQAAGKLGKFPQAHDYIITHFGTVDDSFLEQTAEAIGVTAEALTNATADRSTDAAVWNNHRLFRILGGQVTPTFFIGPDMIYIPFEAMPDAQELKTLFARARGETP